MSGVKWHYEHSVYEETSSLTFFFTGANTEVIASAPCGEDDEGNDLTELFVKGEAVELPLDFVSCCYSGSQNLEELGSAPEKSGGLHLDHDMCKTVQEGSAEVYQDAPDEYLEDWGDDIPEKCSKERDDFYGTGIVRRLPSQDGKPGEIGFEVDQETTTGIVQQLLINRSFIDFLTFQVFSEIAPASFSHPSLLPFGIEDDKAAAVTEGVRSRRLLSRNEPPTSDKISLTDKEFIEVLKDPEARISYRQLYEVLPCKPQTMRGYLANAAMIGHGRLNGQTFAVSELISDLVPYLQGLKPLGEKAYRLLQLFFEAGHISRYNID